MSVQVALSATKNIDMLGTPYRTGTLISGLCCNFKQLAEMEVGTNLGGLEFQMQMPRSARVTSNFKYLNSGEVKSAALLAWKPQATTEPCRVFHLPPAGHWPETGGNPIISSIWYVPT